MIYTINSIPVAGDDFPDYVLLITCIEEEKQVIIANIERYLRELNILLCTPDEFDILNNGNKIPECSKNRMLQLIMGQIMTRILNSKQSIPYDANMGYSVMRIASNQCNAESDLQVKFTAAIKFLIDLHQERQALMYKDKDSGRLKRRLQRVRLFLGDLMLTGFCEFEIYPRKDD